MGGAATEHEPCSHADGTSHPRLVDSAVRSLSVQQSDAPCDQRAEATTFLSDSNAFPSANEALALTLEEQKRFHALYSEHFDFVFRNLRRLGVPAASTDDALQEVYLVVLRRLHDLQQDAHVKAWLFAIVLRVASNQRRALRRRGPLEPLGERSMVSTQPGPFDLTARAQAAQFLHGFLNTLDDNRRAVFIMAELEQLTAPEIAQGLRANLNTVYSWVRSARIAFSKALENVHGGVGADNE
jgi:RNA polymerase sigma-70 factor (ECF subfamily)